MKNLIWIGKVILMLVFFAIVPYNLAEFVSDNNQVTNLLGVVVLTVGTIFVFICSVGLLVKEYQNHDVDIFD